MERQQKRTGLFFGIVFLLGGCINIARVLISGEASFEAIVLDFSIASQLLISALLFASGYLRFLAWAQPLVMFALTPLPLMTSHESFYSLGFYVMGVILLFRLGFYRLHPVPKFIASIAYLFGCELFAALKTGRGIYYALTPIFVIATFLVFLYLSFEEKLVVYLREPKPIFSLKERGLSAAECIYVKSIAEGRTPKEIAIDSNVSESTVRNSLSRAYRKLGIVDKTAIFALAEKYQIVI